jgi:5'-3' exonuclease
MGINNLHKLLRNKCPQIYEEVHLSKYAFKKIAIDISLYLFKYKTIFGDKWLSAFINLVSCMRRNNIHCVFIYDSGAPPEKGAEQAERRETREKLRQKVLEIEEALLDYKENGNISQTIIDFNKKLSKRRGDTNMKKLLRRDIKEDEIKDSDLAEMDEELIKIKNQVISISSTDFDLTKILFDIINVPYFQAPLEAETMCADICIRKQVDAVISEDTDVLAYGAPIFLTKLNTHNDTCTEIKYNDVIKELDISSPQFLDLCIMCGCDYNKNIFRIGPEKAYKLLKEHGNIDDLHNKGVLKDISVLKHNRSRELFRNYQKSNVSIPYCGQPDFKKLQEFVFKHNVSINLSSFHKACSPAVLVFTEEEEDQDEIKPEIQDGIEIIEDEEIEY